MRTRVIAAVVALMLLAVPTRVALADSKICNSGTTCSEAEVGPFMKGITADCGNAGTCSLVDIEYVFDNVASYVLGIVGALVLLMYVLGGFYFLLSGMPGMEKYREKGKTALKTSTIGLVIVFVSFSAIFTLRSILQGNDLSNGVSAYYACGPGDQNAGKACDLNSTCTKDGTCVSACVQQNPSSYSEGSMEGDDSTWTNALLTWSECVPDVNDITYSSDITKVGCKANLCPGPSTEQCCTFSYIP